MMLTCNDLICVNYLFHREKQIKKNTVKQQINTNRIKMLSEDEQMRLELQRMQRHADVITDEVIELEYE